MNIITECLWAGVTCESCCGTSLFRRKVTGEKGPVTELEFRPTLTQSFNHVSCQFWAQSFVSYHLMYRSRMCCNLRSLRTCISRLEHHYWHDRTSHKREARETAQWFVFHRLCITWNTQIHRHVGNDASLDYTFEWGILTLTAMSTGCFEIVLNIWASVWIL